VNEVMKANSKNDNAKSIIMNITIRTAIVCLTVACVSIAAASKTQKHLTAHRIAELTAPTDAPPANGYSVEIVGLQPPSSIPWEIPARPPAADSGPARVSLSAKNPQGTIEVVRELRFPTAFEPPRATDRAPGITPLRPEAFESVNTGWTIRVSAKPQGKLVAIYGVADYVEPELVPGGYGPLAGPIYSEQGALLSPNKLDQPKFQTTSTRFHIFAVAGESYEVTLYRGAKPEIHMVKVSAE
jgi:hypothetical protein